ncbi:hypothetical protein SLE2022_108500 [Rubroshorea leprosula]
MAFASILRKSVTSLVPLAGRLVRVQRNYCYAPLSAALNRAFVSQKPCQSTFPGSLDFSTSANVKKPSSDESLLRVIESEIQSAEESEDNGLIEGVSSDFPFKIEDQPGFQAITLAREYNGETIKVEVNMPDLVNGEENEDVDDDDSGKAYQSSLPLVVTVSKNSGLSLEFSCVAFADEISIDGLAIRNPNTEDQVVYEGPDFQDLDVNLQKSFHKYLEIRGIKPSTTNFLHEYMINKDKQEHLMWLKKLKKFVEA